MQKSTLFVLILAVLVTLTVTNFVRDSQLSGSITANVIPDEEVSEEVASPEEAVSTAPSSNELFDPSFLAPETSSSTTTLLESPSSVPPASSSAVPFATPQDVSSFLEQRNFLLSQITAQDLTQVGFKNMQLRESPFDQMLFQLLDLSTTQNLSVLRMHLTDGTNVFAVLHEFEFENAAKAVSFYSDLKQKVGAFSPLVTSNETNQYGENSYYMNDNNRPGTAFLVFRIRTHVFAFSYTKASHEFFKSLIFLLAK